MSFSNVEVVNVFLRVHVGYELGERLSGRLANLLNGRNVVAPQNGDDLILDERFGILGSAKDLNVETGKGRLCRRRADTLVAGAVAVMTILVKFDFS